MIGRGGLFGLAIACSVTVAFTGPGTAADVAAPAPAAKFQPQVEAPSAWSYRFTPYAWLPGIKGTSTVLGRATDINVSFIEAVEHAQIPKDLFGVMGYFEARNGRISLFTDLVYARVAGAGNISRSRSLGPLGIAVNADVELTFQMATLEAGAAYEVTRWMGAADSFTAFDVMAGGRYWWQKATASLDLTATLNLGGLHIEGNRAIADSGTFSWFDPFVGARIRHQFAPGRELMLSGDIGGFGVGSDLSWQLVGAYSWDFARSGTTTWAGVIGYRALYVDYSKGSGLKEYGYDILQHGPIIGISAIF